MVALGNNLYFGGNYNIADYLAQNLVVLPLNVLVVFSAVVRRRWVDIAAPVLLSCIRAYSSRSSKAR